MPSSRLHVGQSEFPAGWQVGYRSVLPLEQETGGVRLFGEAVSIGWPEGLICCDDRQKLGLRRSGDIKGRPREHGRISCQILQCAAVD